MNRTALRICVIAGALALSACGSHASPTAQLTQPASHVLQPQDTLGGPTSSKMNVLLGDAPAQLGGRRLEHLYVGIREIDAISNGHATELAEYDDPRVVDLLAYQNDTGERVAAGDVDRTSYQQLRFVVDLATSKAQFSEGKSVPLNFLVNVATQSSASAGASTVTTSDGPGAVDLVVTQPFSIAQGSHQTVRVDFNAFESIALDASGGLTARASLFVAPVDQMGGVQGRVIDADGKPVAYAAVVAIAPDGSVGNTFVTDEDGYFSVGTLRAASYRLEIYNTYTTAAGMQIQSVGASDTAQVVEGPRVTVQPGQYTSVKDIAD